METLEKVSGFAGKHMPLICLIVAIVSLIFPNPIQETLPARWMSIPLAIIMFCMVTTLKLDDFKVVFRKPKAVLTGIIAEYTLMPLIALLLVNVFQLSPELAIGVLLVGCCPGGMASNVMAFLAKGDVALSVGITGCATLVAPVVTPALMMLTGGEAVEVNCLEIFMTIVQVMLLPMAAGFLFNMAAPKASKALSRVLPLVSVVCISIVIMSVVSANSERLITGGLLVLVVCLLQNFLGFALGYVAARLMGLTNEQIRSISLEVGMRNSGLSTAIAISNFSTMPLAAIPGAVFSVWQNISGSLCANIMVRIDEKKKAKQANSPE